MTEFIVCQHGVVYKVVNLWHPIRWREGAFGERTFRCPCPESAKPAQGGKRASQVADARSGASKNETTVRGGRHAAA